jgi:hypothetical protein
MAKDIAVYETENKRYLTVFRHYGAEAPVIVPFCSLRFGAEARFENHTFTRS